MKTIQIILSVLLLHNISLAQSVELADIKEEVKIEAESRSQAREKAIQDVLSSIVKKFGLDLLGEKKFEANAAKIQGLTLKESGKFAPVQKADVLTNTSPFTVQVSLKVSPQNLRLVFEKSGLLSSKLESGLVISYITIIDQVRSKAMKWWISEVDEDDFLLRLNSDLHNNLKDKFKFLNFYLINPIDWNFKESISESLQKDYYRKDDYSKLEAEFKTPLVVRGQLDIMANPKVSTAYKLQIKLSALLTSTGKVVAESSRSIETDPGDMQTVIKKISEKIFSESTQDLQDQLSIALQRGVLESSMIQLVLKGDLDYKSIENFRSVILKNIGSVRYISERSIESSKRVYDVDFTGSPNDLAKRITNLKFDGFKAVTDDVSSNSLEIDIKRN